MLFWLRLSRSLLPAPARGAHAAGAQPSVRSRLSSSASQNCAPIWSNNRPSRGLPVLRRAAHRCQGPQRCAKRHRGVHRCGHQVQTVAKFRFPSRSVAPSHTPNLPMQYQAQHIQPASASVCQPCCAFGQAVPTRPAGGFERRRQPNHSIERTCPGVPGRAAHVRR